MHSLEQIKSGELIGTKHISIKCDLEIFPKELFALADTLETLDLSGNRLSSLPSDFYKFKRLKILFCSDNLFTIFPEVLGQCEQLEMIGFKSNQINFISEKALPKQTRWLILTNNKLKCLPKSIGQCHRLQKCALAGNELTALPDEMANCRNLELLRISANKLKSLPDWLLNLPKLAWLAVAGNKFNAEHAKVQNLHEINWNEIVIKELLGEGASGHIYKAIWTQGIDRKDVAVKLFKGEVTSDGYPEDEMQACIAAGEHENLYGLLGTIVGHPQNKLGLVMNLIPNAYSNLGLPPSLVSCTRDTFKLGIKLSLDQIQQIVKQIADVAKHLHENGIMHGDLYAHNILINETQKALLGDFGAAGFYDNNAQHAVYFQKIEVRAWACLLDDLLNLVNTEKRDETRYKKLAVLRDEAMFENVVSRPDFKSILHKLQF